MSVCFSLLTAIVSVSPLSAQNGVLVRSVTLSVYSGARQEYKGFGFSGAVPPEWVHLPSPVKDSIMKFLSGTVWERGAERLRRVLFL